MRRSSAIPHTLFERSNPPPDTDDEDEELEYDCYGWWRFEDDADGVRRLDRQWTSLASAAGALGWDEIVTKYEAKMQSALEELRP